MAQQPLLTIAIPTYNRAKYLKENLAILQSQLEPLGDKVELLISNNCSTDNTNEVVKLFTSNGATISYNCNESNLGFDGNFEYCLRNSSGKYVWLLGDDDYLVDGALQKIIDIIETGENIGLIHIKHLGISQDETKKYTNNVKFLHDVGQNITFISANIVQQKFVKEVNLSKYYGSYFMHIPVFLTAANKCHINIVCFSHLLDGGKDAINNGGYNFFKIFIVNYLKILSEFKECFEVGWYRKEKRKLLLNFCYTYILRFFIHKQSHKFDMRNWKKIIFSKYYYEPYFSYFLCKLAARKIIFLTLRR